MEINDKTKTFAQNEELYILTNEEDLTFDNLDILKHKGCMVNIIMKTISPWLPIGVLTKSIPDWVEPDKQLDIDEVKKFQHVG